MKTSKTKCIVVTLLTMLLAFSLSACGQSDKEKALAEIKAVDVTTYFEDEQDSIKSLKKDYTKKIEAIKDTDNDDKDDKAVAKELKAFRKSLKEFSTKEAKIKSFKDELGKAIDKMDESKAKEAKKILDSYDEKLSKAKTNEAFQKLVTEIGDKIAKKTDVSVATVVESAQEASAPVTYSGGSVSSSSSSSSSGSSGSSSSGSSGGSSSGSSSSGGSSSGGSSQPAVHTHNYTSVVEFLYRPDEYRCTDTNGVVHSFGSYNEMTSYATANACAWNNTNYGGELYAAIVQCSCGATTTIYY